MHSAAQDPLRGADRREEQPEGIRGGERRGEVSTSVQGSCVCSRGWSGSRWSLSARGMLVGCPLHDPEWQCRAGVDYSLRGVGGGLKRWAKGVGNACESCFQPVQVQKKECAGSDWTSGMSNKQRVHFNQSKKDPAWLAYHRVWEHTKRGRISTFHSIDPTDTGAGFDFDLCFFPPLFSPTFFCVRPLSPWSFVSSFQIGNLPLVNLIVILVIVNLILAIVPVLTMPPIFRDTNNSNITISNKMYLWFRYKR